jgi:ADP-ribosyl-[dinitrogen reductase] hydrolase
MRCLPTGLIRTDPRQRRQEAAAISAIIHADPRCVDACVAYCDLIALLLDEIPADHAVHNVLVDNDLHEGVRDALDQARTATLADLDPSTFVLDTLRVAVCALLQRASFESVLVEVVNLGGDADSTGATAGGLLGARDGITISPSAG